MLVITRRPGESITIDTPDGEQIQVVVLGVKGNQIRLCIDAPEDMVILQEKLADREGNGG